MSTMIYQWMWNPECVLRYLYSEVGNTDPEPIWFLLVPFSTSLFCKESFQSYFFSFCPGFPASLCAEMGDILLVTYSMLDSFQMKLGFTCTLLWVNANHYTMHSVNGHWRCGVLSYVATHLTAFSLVFLSHNVCLNISQEFVNQLGNCHLTLLFWTRSNDVLCLARPWVELFQDFLLSWFPIMSPDFMLWNLVKDNV
jgi:hypothetical protein